MSTTYLFFDTCVWLSLAQDSGAAPMLDSLFGHMRGGTVALLVPKVVVDEFERNRGKILERHTAALKTLVNHTRSAAKLLEEREADCLKELAHLAEKKIPEKVAALADALNRVSDLLKHETVIRLIHAQDHAQRVIERALSKQAPFHRNKNSVADALHMECFRDFVSSGKAGGQAIFVTENSSDYSDDKDRKAIHADYSSIFDGKSISFSINVAEVIRELGAFTDAERAVARYALPPMPKYGACPSGEDHSFDESRGAYLRSVYGGLTWQLICSKCGARFDTGDHWD